MSAITKVAKCNTCQDLASLQVTIPIRKLLNSAAQGCEGCVILHKGIRELIEDIEKYESVELVVDSALYAILWTNQSSDHATVEFYTTIHKPTKWKMIGPGLEVPSCTSSNETMLRARQWLDTCIANHNECLNDSLPPLPTRVIEIAQKDHQPRLVLTNGQHGKYAALSHRWGKSGALTTTEKSLESRMESLDLDAASQTFIDALEVTKRLGLPDLWIDSLCIIQDNRDDWERESILMHDIYSRATITISAEGAEDSSQGLFTSPEERASLQKFATMSAHGPMSEDTSVNLRYHHQHPFRLTDLVHSAGPPKQSTLQFRGWILQEELLSPRILHFRKEEIAWTCSKFSRCECKVRPVAPMPNIFRNVLAGILPSKEVSSDSDDSEDPDDPGRPLLPLYEYWPIAIMDFTRRQLTCPTDRYAAVAGLAAHCEKLTHAEYHCGLWLKDMAFGLSWYVDNKDQEEVKDPPIRFSDRYAPSWSWLSLSAPITYYRRLSQVGDSQFSFLQDASLEPYIKPIQCIFSPLRQSKYGPFGFGIMEVAAPIVPVTYHEANRSWTMQVSIKDYEHRFLRVMPDIPSELKETNEDGEIIVYYLMLCGRWRSGQMMTFVPAQAVCLLLRAARTEVEMEVVDYIGKLQDADLLLKTGGTEGVPKAFVRVGLVRGAGSIEAWKESEAFYGFYYLI